MPENEWCNWIYYLYAVCTLQFSVSFLTHTRPRTQKSWRHCNSDGFIAFKKCRILSKILNSRCSNLETSIVGSRKWASENELIPLYFYRNTSNLRPQKNIQSAEKLDFMLMFMYFMLIFHYESRRLMTTFYFFLLYYSVGESLILVLQYKFYIACGGYYFILL